MLAATVGAAKAVCRQDRIGCLAEGYQADLQVWDLPTFEDVIYRIGHNAVSMVLKRGKVVVEQAAMAPRPLHQGRPRLLK